MTITVSGRKMPVTDALRQYAEEKVGNAIKAVDADTVSTEIVLYTEKNPANPLPAICEVTVRVKGHIVRVEESEEDMYAAIDVAAAKVARQLRKYKTRVLDKKVRATERIVDYAHEDAHPESELDLDRLDGRAVRGRDRPPQGDGVHAHDRRRGARPDRSSGPRLFRVH